MTRLVVVSNRVSMPGRDNANKGGLAVGLDQALTQRGGLWFGWNGERSQQVQEQPEHTVAGNITYATQPLTEIEFQHYYLGYSNRVLWPVFHDRPDLMHDEPGYRECYEAVNRRFAAQLRAQLHPDDLIWVHDYHLIPLARYLRALGVENRIGFFLHTPFPAPAMLEHIEGSDQLLSNLLAYDLVGLQTPHDASKLYATCMRLPDVQSNGTGTLDYRDRRTHIEAFPIGVDVDNIRALRRRPLDDPRLAKLLTGTKNGKLIMGVDRLDYSKGIPERVRGYARYIARYQPREPVALLQIAQPSRDSIPEYRAVQEETQKLVDGFDQWVGRFTHSQLRFYHHGLPRPGVLSLLSTSDIGLVTPLRDGMNLVAKEFVAAQDYADPGVLLLGEGAGAAAELEAALLVDPQQPDSIADALAAALHMPLKQRRERWMALFDTVRNNDIDHWAEKILARLTQIRTWPDPQKPRSVSTAQRAPVTAGTKRQHSRQAVSRCFERVAGVARV